MISASRRRLDDAHVVPPGPEVKVPSLALRVSPLLGFLREIGADQVVHTSRRYGAHLAGVYRKLDLWGLGHEVSAAGFFHSIYGTERFREYALDLVHRDDLARLIGRRAEALAYLNSAMVRSEFDRAVESDQPPYRFTDRFSGEILALGERDFRDLVAVHLADWLEQASRVTDRYHRLELYALLALRLGGPARLDFQEAFREELLAEEEARR